MKNISAFMIAGTHSGCGKTTISLAIMASLKKRGLKVQGFKVGPDFIDPGHHTTITERASHNLDGWMMSKDYNQKIFHFYSYDADVAVLEGVMGLYDGFSGKDESGSSAQMAKWLNIPVILVVDASSMARSAAALVLGYKMFDPELNIVGVIFNKVAGKKHAEFIKEAISNIKGIEVFGFLYKNNEITIPSRHLGLITAEDMQIKDSYLKALSEWVEQGIDIEKLLNKTYGYKVRQVFLSENRNSADKIKIGIARDNAFCFYYEENFRLLKEKGTELVFFSPLRDKSLPDGISGLIIGGGYPELYAERLSQNVQLLKEIREVANRGMPIYAECGGFMYLMDTMIIKDKKYKMAGIFPFKCELKNRLMALGYRQIVTKKETILGPSGTYAMGHEFHYSSIVEKKKDNISTVYQVANNNKEEGFLKKNVLGSYIHLHFGSNPSIAENIIALCRRCMLRQSPLPCFS